MPTLDVRIAVRRDEPWNIRLRPGPEGDPSADELRLWNIRERSGAQGRFHERKTILARLPEWSLLDVVTRVAYWTGWPRRFGPVSGFDPKIQNAFGRAKLEELDRDLDGEGLRTQVVALTRRAGCGTATGRGCSSTHAHSPLRLQVGSHPHLGRGRGGSDRHGERGTAPPVAQAGPPCGPAQDNEKPMPTCPRPERPCRIAPIRGDQAGPPTFRASG